MKNYHRFEYKLKDGKRVASAYGIKEDRKEEFSFLEMKETFMHFMIRLEGELGMKNQAEFWVNMLWRKGGGNDSDWKPFMDLKNENGIHREHGIFMYY